MISAVYLPFLLVTKLFKIQEVINQLIFLSAKPYSKFSAAATVDIATLLRFFKTMLINIIVQLQAVDGGNFYIYLPQPLIGHFLLISSSSRRQITYKSYLYKERRFLTTLSFSFFNNTFVDFYILAIRVCFSITLKISPIILVLVGFFRSSFS